ncbi:putative transposase [Paraburkholderia sp. BL6669N2]|nr:putative transposase [Paraburkholderia sp. BL6669N2]
MIDRDHALPVTQQARLLGISRSSAYYQPREVSEADLKLMRRIDELHLDHPFAGARMLARLLRRESITVGRRHVGTLMKRMGVEALYRKPNTSRKHAAHRIWPYLLRNRKIDRANQVWALDTSYIPMARGFVYLTAVVDWASRRVLAHRVAITLERAAMLSRRWRKRLRNTGRLRSSTRIKEASSPQPNSPTRFSAGRFSCRWTEKAPGVTTCSSNGCGAASNMKRFI